MGERALNWGLRLLGVALLLGPILVSLGASNWDIKAAVLPSEAEIDQVRDTVTGIFGGASSQSPWTMGDPSIVGNQVSLPIELRSPFNVPVKIKAFSVSFQADDQVITLNMRESVVEVLPNGTARLTLTGTFSGTITKEPQLSGFGMTMEAFGVEVKIQQSGQL